MTANSIFHKLVNVPESVVRFGSILSSLEDNLQDEGLQQCRKLWRSEAVIGKVMEYGYLLCGKSYLYYG